MLLNRLKTSWPYRHPRGGSPTGIVATTVLVAVSITENCVAAPRFRDIGEEGHALDKDPRRPGGCCFGSNGLEVARPAHDGGAAVGGQRGGGALKGVSNCTGADQLVALLSSDSSLSTLISPACGCESRVEPREAIPGFNPETDVRKAPILGARDY